MSLAHGINSGDLNWDYLESYYRECLTCSKTRKGLRGAERKDFNDSAYCDGHTHLYSDAGWSLKLDTNTNAVSISGRFNPAIFTTAFLIDYVFLKGLTPSIKNLLLERYSYDQTFPAIQDKLAISNIDLYVIFRYYGKLVLWGSITLGGELRDLGISEIAGDSVKIGRKFFNLYDFAQSEL